MQKLTFALTVLLLPAAASADGFDMFSRLDEIKKTVIVEAGDAELVSSPSRSGLSKDVVRLGTYCFEPIGYLSGWSYSKRAALVVADQQKQIKLILLENGIGSIKVTVVPSIQVECSSLR